MEMVTLLIMMENVILMTLLKMMENVILMSLLIVMERLTMMEMMKMMTLPTVMEMLTVMMLQVGETKILELEEELRVVANNLKSLEVFIVIFGRIFLWLRYNDHVHEL